MLMSNIHNAKNHLSRLVDAALQGEDVVIARAGRPLVRLVPIKKPKSPRRLGLDTGKIILHKDFDDPMPELENFFYG